MSLSEVQEIVKDREYLVSCNPQGRRVGHDLVIEQYLAIKIPQFTCCLADEHWGIFSFPAIVKNAALNTPVLISVCESWDRIVEIIGQVNKDPEVLSYMSDLNHHLFLLNKQFLCMLPHMLCCVYDNKLCTVFTVFASLRNSFF